MAVFDKIHGYTDARDPVPSPGELADTGARLLGVDLNADHLAACVVDAHGNPVGAPPQRCR